MHGLIFIILVYFVKFSCLDAVNYHVTSFIEREPFSSNSSQYEYYNLVKTTNISVGVSYVYLKAPDSLAVILNKLSQKDVHVSNKTMHVYSSFASEKISAILENAVSSKEKAFYALQREGCLQKADDIHLLMQKCKKSKTVYIELIKSLMKNLYLWPVAIITDHDECTLRLSRVIASDLKEIIKMNIPQGESDNSTVWTYQLNSTTSNEHEVRQVIYDMKVRSVSIVILLCNDGLSELIFKVASKFSVLRFKKVWLMLESKAVIHDSHAPSQLLVIKFESKETELSSSFLAKKRFLDALNLLLVAKDAKKRGIISNTDFRSLRAIAEKEFATRDCSALHSAKTAFVYLRKSEYNWIPLYKWNDHSNLILLSNDAEFLRISRSKLQGITLRIVTAIEHPFVMRFDQFYIKDQKRCQNGILCRAPVLNNNAVTTWKDTCCIGYLMDLLQKLQNDLWFQTYLYIIEDGFYGAYVNGTWNGMVGDLLRKKADLSVAAITSTRQRSTVVDFSEPYLQVSLSIMMLAQQDNNLPFINFAFLDQISEELLWAILGVFLAGVILVYVLENQSRHVQGKNKKVKNYPLQECFTYFSGLTFQRDLGGHNPKQIATRITAITFAFGMVVVMTTYTAILTASKVKQAETDPFRGMRDHRMTKPTTDFKFACVGNSSTSSYFKSSADPVFRNMYLFMKDYNTKSNEEGIMKVLNGKLQAYITENPMAQFYAAKQRDCGLKIVETDSGKSSWAIGFQKGWAWNYLVSQKILEYRENGLFADLSRKWMASACFSVKNNTGSPNSVPLEYFGGLILVLVVSIVVSVLLLLVENGCKKYRKRLSEPVKDTFTLWKEQREEKRKNSVQIVSFKQTNDVFASRLARK